MVITMRKHKQLFNLLFLGVMLVALTLAVIPSQAATITTYVENFSTGYENNDDPDYDAMYTYSGNWTYGLVNTSNFGGVYMVNCSTTADVHGLSTFAFPTEYTQYKYSVERVRFSLYYPVATGAAGHLKNHSGVQVDVMGASAAQVSIRFYGANGTVTNNKNRIIILDSAGTKVKNVSIHCAYNYTFDIKPYYAYDYINITVYNGTTVFASCDVDTDDNNLYSVKLFSYPNSAKECFFFDTFTAIVAIPTYSAYPSIEQMIVLVAIPAVLGLALIVLIVTGTATPETVVGWLVCFLLYFITIYLLLYG